MNPRITPHLDRLRHARSKAQYTTLRAAGLFLVFVLLTVSEACSGGGGGGGPSGPSFSQDSMSIAVGPGDFVANISASNPFSADPPTYQLQDLGGSPLSSSSLPLDLQNLTVEQGTLSGSVGDAFIGPFSFKVVAAQGGGEDTLDVTLTSPAANNAADAWVQSDGSIEPPLAILEGEYAGTAYSAPPEAFATGTQVFIRRHIKPASSQVLLGLRYVGSMQQVTHLIVPLEDIHTGDTVVANAFRVGTTDGIQLTAVSVMDGVAEWDLPPTFPFSADSELSDTQVVFEFSISPGSGGVSPLMGDCGTQGDLHAGMWLLQLKGAEPNYPWIQYGTSITHGQLRTSHSQGQPIDIVPSGPVCIIVPGFRPNLPPLFDGYTDPSWLSTCFSSQYPVVQWARTVQRPEVHEDYYKSVFVLGYDTHDSIDNNLIVDSTVGTAQQLDQLLSLPGGFWQKYQAAQGNGADAMHVPMVDFICHSEGGIVVRRYLQNYADRSLDGDFLPLAQVRAYLSLATPQNGVSPAGYLAQFTNIDAIRDMLALFPQMRELNRASLGEAWSNNYSYAPVLIDNAMSPSRDLRVFTVAARADLVVVAENSVPAFLSDSNSDRRMKVDSAGMELPPFGGHSTIHTSWFYPVDRWAMGNEISYQGDLQDEWRSGDGRSTSQLVEEWLFPIASVQPDTPCITGQPARFTIQHSGHTAAPMAKVSRNGTAGPWENIVVHFEMTSGGHLGSGTPGTGDLVWNVVGGPPTDHAVLQVWDGNEGFYVAQTIEFPIRPNVTPQVWVTPISGPQGTVFSEPGSGFTPNGGVTLHFRRPDGFEYPTLHKTANGSGAYSHLYPSSSSTPIGLHQYWAIDDTTGVSSNVFDFWVTALPNPQVWVTPVSGPQGTVFSEPGSGFTPNGGVTLHFRRPNGSEYPTLHKTADASGAYSHLYPSSPSTPVGHHQYWAIDDTTSISSNVFDFWVTAVLTPQVWVSPVSGPQGTTFSEPGSGFTPNGGVTLHFRRPDGSEYPTLHKTADGSGAYSHLYPSSPATPVGHHQYWAIDDTTGVSSNVFDFWVTAVLTPQVWVTPISGPQGTVFSEPGSGFTPNGGVTLHFRRPDGSEYPTLHKTANGSGAYSHLYPSSSSTPIGLHQYWAIDDTTGVSSNVFDFWVTAVPTPQVWVSPVSGPQGTLFSEPGSGFTPNGGVTLHFRRPNGSEYPTVHKTADGNGAYSHSYQSSSSTPIGMHQHWAIDDTTGVSSNIFDFWVY